VFQPRHGHRPCSPLDIWLCATLQEPRPSIRATPFSFISSFARHSSYTRSPLRWKLGSVLPRVRYVSVLHLVFSHTRSPSHPDLRYCIPSLALSLVIASLALERNSPSSWAAVTEDRICIPRFLVHRSGRLHKETGTDFYFLLTPCGITCSIDTPYAGRRFPPRSPSPHQSPSYQSTTSCYLRR
jgi:hypothetical protein